MTDRGLVKWKAFESITSGDKILKEIEKKKRRVPKPILSSDQYEQLNIKLLEAYRTGSKSTIMYYKDGEIREMVGKVETINNNKKIIVLDNNYHLYFEQILDINI